MLSKNLNRADHDLSHCHSRDRCLVILSVEKDFLFADSAATVVVFFQNHYSVFAHSTALPVLAVVVAAVACSAAFFDFHTVSFHFAAGQNSFGPVADAALPVVASFRFDGVQRHRGFAVAVVGYFFAPVACASRSVYSFPGRDAQIDFDVAHYLFAVVVAADASLAYVSFLPVSAPFDYYHYFAALFSGCFDRLFFQHYFAFHYSLFPGFFAGTHSRFACRTFQNCAGRIAFHCLLVAPGAGTHLLNFFLFLLCRRSLNHARQMG